MPDHLGCSKIVAPNISENVAQQLQLWNRRAKKELGGLGVAQDRPQRLVQLMCDRSRQRCSIGAPAQAADLQETAAQFALSFSVFMDVGARADIAKKCTVAGVAWNSGIVDPAIGPIVATEPIFHSKFIPCVKMASVDFQATTKVVMMNAFRP